MLSLGRRSTPPLVLSFLVLCALVAPSHGDVGPPNGPSSTVPCGINLVSMTGGVPDPLGIFTIIVRDADQNPVPFTPVVIDFSNCPDIRLCASQPAAGASVQCSGASGSIRAMTDEDGTVTLSLVGGATNVTSGVPGSVFQCATVSAGDPLILLANVNVGAFDQNGTGGVVPADISRWLGDSFSPGLEPRSDYNCTQSINPADLSRLLDVVLGGGSVSSCATYCQ
jgi:hypothetical protein